MNTLAVEQLGWLISKIVGEGKEEKNTMILRSLPQMTGETVVGFSEVQGTKHRRRGIA